MQLEKELFLYDNDVYILGLTNEYIVVNHNYKGIKYYDHNLNFLKQISFQDEIIIYQLYSSLNDNNIVILDVENEKMHIIKLDGKNDDIITIVQKEIFLNYFYSYEEYFELKKQDILYKFSYYNGFLLEKRDSIYGNILDNNQDKLIYCIENQIIYQKGKYRKTLPFAYDNKERFCVNDKTIIRYSENQILIYKDFKLHVKKNIDKLFSVRKVQIIGNRVLILINNKEYVDKSKLISYIV